MSSSCAMGGHRPITSVSISFGIDQARYQPQQRLMFGIRRMTVEKRADLDVGYSTAGGRVWFVPNEHTAPIAA